MKFLRMALPLAAIAAAVLCSCGVGPDARVPSLRYQSSASGCGNINVYAKSIDEREVLVVNALKEELGLTREERSFDIASTPRLQVWIDIYARRPESSPYCTDVLYPNAEIPASWKAVAGTVTISLSDADAPFNQPYTATIRLDNVVFVDPDGSGTVTLERMTMRDVTVGWLPG